MKPLEADDPPVIGSYRLLGRLGSGGMGRVYLARSEGGRTVAVKVVHPHFATDDEFRARFRREVDSARRVGTGVGTGPDGHRWSAPVLDADPEAAIPWVVTGYVAGPSLTQAVGAHGPLPEHSVRALGAGLAEALVSVHELRLVHRDVKPSNVLLALDGPRLIDFGIARAMDGTASLTSTGVSVGSPGYMSPEQILGKNVSGAADVFSLGAVLAFAVTGERPFAGDSSAALLYKVVHEEPELGAMEGELRELVAGCLAKDPSARPAPAEVALRLAPAGAGGLVAVGWLPGPLVQEVSRAAVRLLDLEAAAPPVQTGPVPFSNPSLSTPSLSSPSFDGPSAGGSSVGGPSAGNPSLGHAPLGVFGPPMDPPKGTPVPASAPALVPEQRAPEQRASDGRLSVSVSADTTTGTGAGTGTGTGRRSRQVSCTLALAVAGALAAVTVGGAFFLKLLPGTGNDAGSDDSAASRPSSTAAPSAASDAPVTELPKGFAGSWKGATTERNGLKHGDLVAVFTKGAKGEDVVRTVTSLSVFGVTAECYGVGKLLSGTATELRVEERADPEKPGTKGMCTGKAAEVTYTLMKNGSLRYESTEEEAGKPTGTLTKLTRQ
ncbi:serine/threonine-protein kinase [Streptomyces sp. NPDC088400]|uniref:serine/threonine-protein kinase n=1 Tax=Streptomyces sp. NPDC088400 TaxID=3365861 RepID=UPI00382E7481